MTVKEMQDRVRLFLATPHPIFRGDDLAGFRQDGRYFTWRECPLGLHSDGIFVAHEGTLYWLRDITIDDRETMHGWLVDVTSEDYIRRCLLDDLANKKGVSSLPKPLHLGRELVTPEDYCAEFGGRIV